MDGSLRPKRMTEVVKHEDEDGFGEEGFKDAGVEERWIGLD